MYSCDICRCSGYVYANHMQMPRIWVCKGYAFFSLFSLRSVFRLFRICFLLPGAPPPENTTCATQPAAISSVCCVLPRPRDPPPRAGKDRCGYSLAVLHFRKVSDTQKTGSPENSHPVIYPRGYMNVNHQVSDDYGR